MANDADFYNGDTEAAIVITAVVCDLPDTLTTRESFGHLQGRWLKGEFLEQFEEEEGEAAIRIELRVDATLEPRWNVVSGNESKRTRALVTNAAVGEESMDQPTTREKTSRTTAQ